MPMRANYQPAGVRKGKKLRIGVLEKQMMIGKITKHKKCH